MQLLLYQNFGSQVVLIPKKLKLMFIFSGELEKWLLESLEFVIKRTKWPLRKALPIAQVTMWINYLSNLAENARNNANTNDSNYPGSR